MARRRNGDARDRRHEGDGLPVRRPTRIRPEGRLVLVDPQANSRLLAFLVGNFFHRVERDRSKLCFGDLDLARVAEAIGLIAIEARMRDAAFRERYRSLQSIIGVDGQRAANAASIAAATGIPRETVRRKLKRLATLGYIVKKGRARYVVAPGMLQEPDRQAAFGRAFDQLAVFMNHLLEQGLLEWVPAERTARFGGRIAPP